MLPAQIWIIFIYHNVFYRVKSSHQNRLKNDRLISSDNHNTYIYYISDMLWEITNKISEIYHEIQKLEFWTCFHENSIFW